MNADVVESGRRDDQPNRRRAQRVLLATAVLAGGSAVGWERDAERANDRFARATVETLGVTAVPGHPPNGVLLRVRSENAATITRARLLVPGLHVIAVRVATAVTRPGEPAGALDASVTAARPLDLTVEFMVTDCAAARQAAGRVRLSGRVGAHSVAGTFAPSRTPLDAPWLASFVSCPG